MILADGCADTDPRIAVLSVDFYEILKGHIKTPGNMQLIFVLVIGCFALGGKSSFCSKLRLTFPVLIVELDIPDVGLFVFVSGHSVSSLCCLETVDFVLEVTAVDPAGHGDKTLCPELVIELADDLVRHRNRDAHIYGYIGCVQIILVCVHSNCLSF